MIFFETIVNNIFFLGNSLSAILDGTARLNLLNRGEDYIITMPYANCKGICFSFLKLSSLDLFLFNRYSHR